ncbi:MAG: helix-turn-helix transcriptional regulator, partial [Nocardioides sp.]
MAHLDLSVADVTEIRRLLTLDEEGHPDRIRYCLVGLMRLVPCDVAGFAIGDRSGCTEQTVVIPDRYERWPGLSNHDSAWVSGVEHCVSRLGPGTPYPAVRASPDIRDALRVGFEIGDARVAQIWLGRRTELFEPRHVEILSMLEPALARVVRRPPASRVSAALSASERRVLQLVALGGTNRDIACRLAVTEATVRKHLE